MTGSNLGDAGLEGALHLLFALPRSVSRLPEILGGMREVVGETGRSVGDALSAVNPFGLSDIRLGPVAEQASTILGELGNLIGSAGSVSGDAISAADSVLASGTRPASPAGTLASSSENSETSSAASRSSACDASPLLHSPVDAGGSGLDRNDTVYTDSRGDLALGPTGSAITAILTATLPRRRPA